MALDAELKHPFAALMESNAVAQRRTDGNIEKLADQVLHLGEQVAHLTTNDARLTERVDRVSDRLEDWRIESDGWSPGLAESRSTCI